MLGDVEVNGEALRFQEAAHDVPGEGNPPTLHLQWAGVRERGFFSIEFASPLPRRGIAVCGQTDRHPHTVGARERTIRDGNAGSSGPPTSTSWTRSRRSASIYMQATAQVQNEMSPWQNSWSVPVSLQPPSGRRADCDAAVGRSVSAVLIVNRRVAVAEARLYRTVISWSWVSDRSLIPHFSARGSGLGCPSQSVAGGLRQTRGGDRRVHLPGLLLPELAARSHC